MTDQEKIIREMKRAYWTTDGTEDQRMAAVLAICAPAVRERCAEEAVSHIRQHGPNGVAAAIRALPLDGLTGSKGESERIREAYAEIHAEQLARPSLDGTMHFPSAPAPEQAGTRWDRMSGIMRCLVTGNPVLTDTHPVGHPCQCKNCRTALAALAKGDTHD